MDQEKFSGPWGNKQRNIILLIMITILIIYIAVPIYGVIQDAKQGGTVFKIEGPIPGTGEGNSILDKIIDFFFESDEIPVPVNYIIDVEGTVLYSDNTPYSNKTVELRSTPRYTRTDQNGHFVFRAVKVGVHTISVFDESGNIVASCNTNISVDKNTTGIGNVSFTNNTYIIHVSANVEVLEIKLVLDTDDEGNAQGISNLEIISVETTPPQQEDPGNEPPDEPEQPGEPDQPGEEPNPPVPGGTTGGGVGGSGGGGGGGGGTPPEFNVYDSNSTASFGHTAAAQINIFGSEKRIAPGMKGSYRFTVDNTKNGSNFLCTVEFAAIDTLPSGSKIPMVFRLKAGNSYVAGDAVTWESLDQLDQDMIVTGNSKLTYTMEWYWPEGGNDNQYRAYSQDAGYSYNLKIEVTAQSE